VTTQDFSPDDEHFDDPFEIDTSVAHPARRYNYWLGGSDNFEADRASGDAGEAAFPAVRIAAMENRRFMHRAVAFLVKEAGIRQFLDIGTGIPSAGNVHEVAQTIAPETHVVYVDNDPIVLAHARRLLSRTAEGTTTYIHADLRAPDQILGHPDLVKTLDLSRPVALMLVAVAQFLDDEDDPYARVGTLTRALAPGSYLVMSHGTHDFWPADVKAAMTAWIQRERSGSRYPMRARNKAEFTRFFEGMDFVSPGVVAASEWRNDDPPHEHASVADTASYGAVAKIAG
jgi:SAM-dependent methyltransferase